MAAREARRVMSASEALGKLEKLSTKKALADHGRYGITFEKAFGVPMGKIKALAKTILPDQDLAQALWDSGWYEARLLAAFVGEPERLDVKTMNAWASEFDSWAVVDTLCFSLFDRSPKAWSRIGPWARARPEFKKRAAFALLWSLALHDKEAPDSRFEETYPLIARAAEDERDYVKKGVDMALRAIGTRSTVLHRSANDLAKTLATSDSPSAAWIGRKARREFQKKGPRNR